MTMNKKPFLRAEEGLSNSVIYYDEDGNKVNLIQQFLIAGVAMITTPGCSESFVV